MKVRDVSIRGQGICCHRSPRTVKQGATEEIGEATVILRNPREALPVYQSRAVEQVVFKNSL